MEKSETWKYDGVARAEGGGREGKTEKDIGMFLFPEFAPTLCPPFSHMHLLIPAHLLSTFCDGWFFLALSMLGLLSHFLLRVVSSPPGHRLSYNLAQPSVSLAFGKQLPWTPPWNL